MEEYLERINRILDQAASDDSLSTADYAELCGNVADEAQGRCDAAESDLDS